MQNQDFSEDSSKDRCFVVKIPEPIRSESPTQGALFLEFGDTECLTVHNQRNLYFLEMAEKVVVRYSSYAIHHIKEIVSIIRGYLLVITKDQKLWLFELKKEERKQESIKSSVVGGQKVEQKGDGKLQKILKVESFLKDAVFSSYFVREVTPNMVELFIVNGSTEQANKTVYVYQFTVNQKVGGMGFTLDKNYKMVNHSRRHLYASKTFYDSSILSIVKLKNFSDQAFSVRKIDGDFLYMIPVGKTEDFYCLNKNYELFHPENPNTKVSIKNELKGYQLQQGIQHMNYLLLKNQCNQVGLFIIEEPMKVKILAVQSFCLKWSICFNGRLVGVRSDNQTIIVTEEFNKKSDRLKADQNRLEENLSKEAATTNVENNDISSLGDSKKEKIMNNLPPSSPSINKQEVPKKKNIQENLNAGDKKREEPEASKHKSSFKPTKIVCRKDIKKQKPEKPEEQPLKQFSSTQKKIQQSVSPSSETQRGIIQSTKESKAEQSDEKTPNKKDENIHPILSENDQKSKELPVDKLGEQANNQKEQIDFGPHSEKKCSNQISTSSKERVEVLEPEGDSAGADLNLMKSKVINKIGQNFIPSVNYQEIFGKNKTLLEKSSPLLFEKTNLINELEINKLSSAQKNQRILIDGKELERFKSNGQQIEKINAEVQFVQDKNQKIQNEKNQESKEGSCCNFLGHTKNSLDNFVDKIGILQKKSEQVHDEFKSFEKQLTKNLEIEIRKGEEQMRRLSEQKSTSSINRLLQISLNDYLSKKLTPKVNQYFRSVMGESKKIYENTARFYSEKKKQSIISLQNHFQEQEHLVKQIKSISCEMLASVQNTIIQGEQSHAYLLKEWNNHVKQINSKLENNMQSLDNHLHDRSASERQKIMDSLGQIRETIEATRLETQQLKEASQSEKKASKQEEVRTKKQKVRKGAVEVASKVRKSKEKKANKEKYGGKEGRYELPYMYHSPFTYYY